MAQLDKTPNQRQNHFLAGTGSRVVEVDSTGLETASKEVIIGKLSDATAISLLTNTDNWDPGTGEYNGTTITGTYEGQYYSSAGYFYYAYSNDSWLRISIQPNLFYLLTGTNPDLDLLDSTGTYQIDGTVTNGPTSAGSNTGFILIVFEREDAVVIQLFVDPNDLSMHIRRYDTSWGSWSNVNKAYFDTLYKATFTENTAFNRTFETSTSNIQMNGAVSVGSSDNVPRADHVHASDTTKMNLNITRVSITGTDSLESGDNGKILEFDSTSAFNFTLDQMSDGFNCTLININTGDVTLVAGSGVTIRHETINRKLATRWRFVSLYFRSATEVVIAGTLEA